MPSHNSVSFIVVVNTFQYYVFEPGLTLNVTIAAKSVGREFIPNLYATELSDGSVTSTLE